MHFVSHSEEETITFASEFAKKLRPGMMLALTGELGSGKTCFVRGLCTGLNIKETVHSPTFAILNIYISGDMPVYHFDAYRMRCAEEIREAGFEEYMGIQGICVIEWADRVKDIVPGSAVWIEFRHKEENVRELSIKN